jgi:hypothetical protein
MMHVLESNLSLNFEYNGRPKIRFKCLQAVWGLSQLIHSNVWKAILKFTHLKYDWYFYMRVDTLFTIRQCNPVQAFK